MKHFAYVLYVGFHAKRNLCDKQNVLFYGTPRISPRVKIYETKLWGLKISLRTADFDFSKLTEEVDIHKKQIHYADL